MSVDFDRRILLFFCWNIWPIIYLFVFGNMPKAKKVMKVGEGWEAKKEKEKWNTFELKAPLVSMMLAAKCI